MMIIQIGTTITLDIGTTNVDVVIVLIGIITRIEDLDVVIIDIITINMTIDEIIGTDLDIVMIDTTILDMIVVMIGIVIPDTAEIGLETLIGIEDLTGII